MTEFTPGPWKLIWHSNTTYPFPLSVHTEDDSSWIARDGTISSEANARLIAAAPDLLAALEGMMASSWLSIDHDRNRMPDAMDYRDKARAAIAKAKEG